MTTTLEPGMKIPEWNETGLHKTEYFRQRRCLSCDLEFVAPVVLSKYTTNLSGERSVQCPKCDSRAIFSKAMHKVTDYQVRITIPKMVKINPNNTEAVEAKLAKCEEFLNNLPDLEARFGLFHTLQESLEIIHNIHVNTLQTRRETEWKTEEDEKRYKEWYAKRRAWANEHPHALLYNDFAPLSFGWTGGGMTGGLIFHGPHDRGGDGGAPTFCVNLGNTHGWSIHT